MGGPSVATGACGIAVGATTGSLVATKLGRVVGGTTRVGDATRVAVGRSPPELASPCATAKSSAKVTTTNRLPMTNRGSELTALVVCFVGGRATPLFAGGRGFGVGGGVGWLTFCETTGGLGRGGGDGIGAGMWGRGVTPAASAKPASCSRVANGVP